MKYKEPGLPLARSEILRRWWKRNSLTVDLSLGSYIVQKQQDFSIRQAVLLVKLLRISLRKVKAGYSYLGRGEEWLHRLRSESVLVQRPFLEGVRSGTPELLLSFKMVPSFKELINKLRSDEERQRLLREAMINVTAFAIGVGAILLARQYVKDSEAENT